MRIRERVKKVVSSMFFCIKLFFISKIFKLFFAVLFFVFLLYILKLIVGESGVVELVGSLSWPVAIVLVSFLFKESIEHIAKRVDEFSGLGLFIKTHSSHTVESAGQLNLDNESTSLDDNGENIDSGIDAVDQVEEACKKEKYKENVKNEDSTNEKNKLLKARVHGADSGRIKNIHAERVASKNWFSHKDKFMDSSSSLVSKIKKNLYFERDRLIATWELLIEDIDNIYYSKCGDLYQDVDMDALDKMRFLKDAGVVSNQQLYTFEKLYEASGFFSSGISISSINNYKLSIQALIESLYDD